MQIQSKFVNATVAPSTATTTTVYTPASGKKFILMGYTVSVTGADVVTISVSGSTPVIKFDFAANGGANLISSDVPLLIGAADGAVSVITSQATTCYLTVFGYEA
jgi:hypothetical protein